MKASGFSIVKVAGRDVSIRPEKKEPFVPFAKAFAVDTLPLYSLDISGAARITGTSEGILHVQFTDDPMIHIETISTWRTGPQMSTLRGVERFLFWAQEGHKPRSGDQDIYWIHEALLDEFSQETVNPVNGQKEIIRTGSPAMTKKIMAQIINGALNHLAETDIPKEVADAIGEDMKKLWETWYTWRYSGEDPLAPPATLSWEGYTATHPVCELCAQLGTESDPLIKAHIVSRGADASNIEMAWNWIRMHQSHHLHQHNHGWGQILSRYSFIKGKIDRAQEVARKSRITVPPEESIEDQGELEIY